MRPSRALPKFESYRCSRKNLNFLAYLSVAYEQFHGIGRLATAGIALQQETPANRNASCFFSHSLVVPKIESVAQTAYSTFPAMRGCSRSAVAPDRTSVIECGTLVAALIFLTTDLSPLNFYMMSPDRLGVRCRRVVFGGDTSYEARYDSEHCTGGGAE